MRKKASHIGRKKASNVDFFHGGEWAYLLLPFPPPAGAYVMGMTTQSNIYLAGNLHRTHWLIFENAINHLDWHVV